MARTLAATVHLTADNGHIVTYLPGDTPMAEHAELITNPDAWAQDPAADDPPADATASTADALLEALLADDDTVAAWLDACTVQQVLDAVTALPDDYIPAAVPLLATIESARQARKTLLAALEQLTASA